MKLLKTVDFMKKKGNFDREELAKIGIILPSKRHDSV
jgi:hypothetical protein